ncbi:probable glutathione S-transferase MSR-1 [Typha angustifolia]|uniref:probable glutathione S-transferase MSR-1 n=1 Tax=Typha angustifolia TaxID=59011 RepID=UPI003C30D2F0
MHPSFHFMVALKELSQWDSTTCAPEIPTSFSPYLYVKVDSSVYDTSSLMWKLLHKEAQEEIYQETNDTCPQKLLEGGVGNEDYFGGDSSGLVDVAFVSFTYRFCTYERPAPASA